MKIISFNITILVVIFLILSLTSCSDTQANFDQKEPERTAHLLSLDVIGDLRVGSRVVNEDGETIGVVKELISGESGNRQHIEVEKSYLKYPAASFKISLDFEGKICLLAFYPE